VTTNLCLNRLRDEGRRSKLIARKSPSNDPSGSDIEVRVDVAKVLGSVPSELRDIAICYHADGMTCNEIAATLGVSRRTVGNRLVTFQAIASGVMGNA
jgi:RNA polymerase sigma-70 factor (ECF subfamily)